VNLPAQIDSMKLLEAAVADHVAFVPGAPFFANDAQRNTLRLSFVTVPPEKIEEGVARLGKLLRERLDPFHLSRLSTRNRIHG
jgi:2-aminoadipate transaminase